MSLLFIIHGDAPVAEQELQLFNREGIATQSIRPAFLSAFTSMLIAGALKKSTPRAIVAFRIKDAQAAISARKLSEARDMKIVVQVTPNSPKPISIPSEVKNNVDLWIFPSQRLAALYPADITKTVLPMALPEDFDTTADTCANAFIWAAPIDGNTERLCLALRTIDNLPTLPQQPEPSIAICGQGKARNTMPAVRAHRAMQHPARVKWLAEGYNLHDLCKGSAGILQGAPDATPIELALANEKRPLYVCDGESMSLSPESPYGASARGFAREFMALL